MAKWARAGSVVAAGLMALTAGCSSSNGSTRSAGGAACPNGGTVRWGVEPYAEAAKLTPIYKPLASLISKKLGCKVDLTITNNYTAEIEAMRSKKLDMGEFGPLGYLLANKEANAEAVATFGTADGKPATYTASIVAPKGTGINELAGCKGKEFAFSDPASTSGHLEPAYALKQAGIDPERGVKPIYPGSHTASFEAIRNNKVKCGELNSSTIATAKDAGEYNAGNYTTLWKSEPIPFDPIAVRSDLSPAFKTRLTKVLTSIDFSELPASVRKGLADNTSGTRIVPQSDSAYDGLRKLVDVLHLDLHKTEG